MDVTGLALTADETAELQDRWSVTTGACTLGAPSELVELAGRRLLDRWCEPHRRYHTPRHLLTVLRALDEIAATGGPAGPELTLAAWGHDVVEAPGQPDNVDRSAAVVDAELAGLGVPHELRVAVRRLIAVTGTHQPSTPDEARCATPTSPSSRAPRRCTPAT